MKTVWIKLQFFYYIANGKSKKWKYYFTC